MDISGVDRGGAGGATAPPLGILSEILLICRKIYRIHQKGSIGLSIIKKGNLNNGFRNNYWHLLIITLNRMMCKISSIHVFEVLSIMT